MPWLSRPDGSETVDLHYEADGDGRIVVFLHGLAGHCGEWATTAAAVSSGYRSIRLDQRGHGLSTRRPADLSRAAFAADVAALIEHSSRGGPVPVIGQSMGAHTALVLAGLYPDLVSHLIMVEGDVGGGGQQAVDEICGVIQGWPSSFASLAEVTAFFGGDTEAGRAWAAGYFERGGRWWPRFDPNSVAEVMAPVFERERWDIWEELKMPVDLVMAARSWMDPDRIGRMRSARPDAGYHVIPGAGHDVHLDQPERWHQLLESLLTARMRKL